MPANSELVELVVLFVELVELWFTCGFLHKVKTLTKTQQPVSQDSKTQTCSGLKALRLSLRRYSMTVRPKTLVLGRQHACGAPSESHRTRAAARMPSTQHACGAPSESRRTRTCVQPACVRPPSESHGCALNTSIPRFGRASSFPTRLGGSCLLAQLLSPGHPWPTISPSNRRVP